MKDVMKILRNIRPGARSLAAPAAVVVALFMVLMAATVRADWLTYRGSAARLGTLDRDFRPILKPKVLWTYKTPENFIAAPVPEKNILFVSALGGFNSAQIYAINMQEDPTTKRKAGETLWSKSSPFIKLPTVSSPAVFNNVVIFGDGMHQTDGAALYAFDITTGHPLWRYELDGKLVHMEGSPVVDPKFPGGPAVFIGGGDAGVLAIAAGSATFEGKNLTLAQLRDLQNTRWENLAVKYEAQKKKDPDFAIPPSDDALPKPLAKKLWQAGEKQWHVDAPLVLAGKDGDRIIVSSAFIENDHCGKRVVACLDKKDGKTLWETAVDLNPWAGATVDGENVIVGCSSIRYDRDQLSQGKGLLYNLDLATGNVKWKKELSGGVLGAVAVSDGMAVCTTTNGRVRAFDIASGEQKWRFAVDNSGFFTAPVISGTGENALVYAADLRGVLHAVKLATGEALWAMDVGRDNMVQAPGGFYSSPVLHDGALYLATCNLQGDFAGQPCAIACIVDETFKPASARPKVIVDKVHRYIDIPALVAPRKLPTLKDIYPLEVVATYPTPQGQKAHETVVITEVLPSELHKALVGLGATAGVPIKGDGEPTGSLVAVSLVIPGLSGKDRVIPIEKCIIDQRTGKPLPPLHWRFTGSAYRQLDPDKPEKAYGADIAGTFVTIYPVTDETVIQSDLPNEAQSSLKLEMNRNIIPEENAPLRLRIEVLK